MVSGWTTTRVTTKLTKRAYGVVGLSKTKKEVNSCSKNQWHHPFKRQQLVATLIVNKKKKKIIKM